ncbi:MAG: hypothetical protein N2559_18080, partial [Anaerolineae bacterium]|nr:hypothetical protein [Anaerolineae bacterium]
MQIVEETIQREPLHFYTTVDANKRWLGSIFGGKTRNNRIDGMTVPFGTLRLDLTGRRQDEEYAFAQLAWTLEFVANNGGLGAKLQHGFGQIVVTTSLTQYTTHAEQDLKNRLGEFKSDKNNSAYPTRQRFFSNPRSIPTNNALLQAILRSEPVGSKPQHATYIPCVFDLRYKGDVVEGKQLGFRKWLASRKWKDKDICALLGETKARHDEDRSASQVYFGMPWRNQRGDYTLHVFGFAPPTLDVNEVDSTVKEYL